ncbi:MAG: sodium:alanine symporter family protein, partial [Alphaproteobacteria bacterium]|nr:sodium:alanine symporter family protein [Alphaproteobacteria bacterium]
MTLDQQIDAAVKPLNDVVNAVVFYPLPLPGGAEVPFIVAWLVLAGLFATFYTGFVGLRHFAHGWDLSFNPKHQVADATKKGEISNFQALAGALAGTIGLGNIAGVAVALSVGGPGATFWMILMGFLGMNT